MDKKRFRFSSVVLRCVLAGGAAHSLYTRIRKEGITEWKQPVSGLDEPYMMGDKVTYLGDTWENEQDNNYYAPDVWGWRKVL